MVMTLSESLAEVDESDRIEAITDLLAELSAQERHEVFIYLVGYLGECEALARVLDRADVSRIIKRLKTVW